MVSNIANRLLVLSLTEKVSVMSGGSQLSETHPSASDVYVNVPQSGVATIVRAVIEECMKNPHEFVENEQARRGK